MPNAAVARRIRIFVSSPGDVAEEREQYAAAVQELNLTLGALLPEQSVVLELVKWETHVHPDMSGEPQRVVDEQIEIDYDVFVGIMWARFGTPTSAAESGTEHEFRAAHRSSRDRGRPAHLLFYFCDVDVPMEYALQNSDQLARISKFRKELKTLGIVGSYSARRDFGSKARLDLVRVVGRLLRPQESAAETAGRVGERASEADLHVIRRQVGELARQYDETRAAMHPTAERTRRLEVVASTMRTLAQSSYVLLSELVESSDPGSRLAAICALQVVPDRRYLNWLAGRMSAEKPFIAYHAAIALLAAARELRVGDLEQVDAAVTAAEVAVSHLRPDTDRVKTVRLARAEVDRHRHTGALARPYR